MFVYYTGSIPEQYTFHDIYYIFKVSSLAYNEVINNRHKWYKMCI